MTSLNKLEVNGAKQQKNTPAKNILQFTWPQQNRTAEE